MDGNLKSKRVRWKQRTDAAFERMCAGKSAAELVTMDEREEMAMVLAKEMAAFLLEEHSTRSGGGSSNARVLSALRRRRNGGAAAEGFDA